MSQTRFDLADTRIKRALHAYVGATELAVERVRDYVGQTVDQTQRRITDLQQGISKSVTDFEPAQFAGSQRAAIEKRVAQLQAGATETYGDLVKRGETLVGRIRRQQSTQEAVAAAETTVAKAKTTRTQAAKKRPAARSAAKSSAKATRTAAKKTVSAGSRALIDAAEKIGD